MKNNEQELLLETNSDEVGPYDSHKDINIVTDTDTNKGHDEDSADANESQVHTWSRSQDTWGFEDTRGALCE
jgi:hypothetical protein